MPIFLKIKVISKGVPSMGKGVSCRFLNKMKNLLESLNFMEDPKKVLLGKFSFFFLLAVPPLLNFFSWGNPRTKKIKTIFQTSKIFFFRLFNFLVVVNIPVEY